MKAIKTRRRILYSAVASVPYGNTHLTNMHDRYWVLKREREKKNTIIKIILDVTRTKVLYKLVPNFNYIQEWVGRRVKWYNK